MRSPHGLLTVHFLREFLENDLISPDADRSQLLAVVGATMVSLTLFISVMMSAQYIGPFLTPGQAAILSLDDKFFYLALAMIVSALVATTQWDALTVNPRDAAILEPLPVAAGTIRRAKISAVAILGAAVAVALNACPSIVFPWLLVFNFPQLSIVSMATLMVTHAMVTTAAAAFGYLTIIAARELMTVLLGRRWFTLVSPWAQGVLIVVIGGSLLLLPPASNRIAQRGFEGWRADSPPMWFLGIYETAVGSVLADLPRGVMRPRLAERDVVTTAMYQQRRDRFPILARRAVLALPMVLLIATLAYMWNARRLPSLAPAPPPAFRHRWGFGGRIANAAMLRHAAARAGFYFTLAAMWRSNTHRLTLSCAAAAGFAMAVLALWNTNLREGGDATARVLSMQPLLYGALLVGFRHVIRVPAELRANWGFQLAWRGHERAFVSGVKWAAVVALVLPALAILLPFFAFVMGAQLALMHAVLGFAGALVMLEALMLQYDKVPFTCTYLPSEHMKALAPIYAIAFLVGASFFARLEFNALYGAHMLSTLTMLAIFYAMLRVVSAKRARLPSIEFDEVPATFQRLGLDG